ncbi:MAG: hypothetical protein E2586_16760 [Novosphingobium sp.]|nr:hypothetical protein [Novosphingobium sp.]
MRLGRCFHGVKKAKPIAARATCMATAFESSIPPPARPGAATAMRLGYSSGNMGKSLVWSSFESVLLYFLVLHGGVPVTHAGVLLTLLMVWDGLADLAIAYRTDRTGRQDGLARLIGIGAPLCGACFALIFAAPVLGGTAFSRTAIVVAAVIGSRIGYTLCDVGHNTLMVRMAASERDSSGISALRLIFSALGAGCTGLALAQVLAIHDPSDQRRAFVAFGVAGGTIYLSTLLIARGVTRHLPATGREPSRGGAVRMVRSLLADSGYRQILGIVAVQGALVPFFMRALPFLGRATMSEPAWPGWALFAITLGHGVSLPLWMSAARWRSSRDILALAHLGFIAAMAGFALAFRQPAATACLFLLGASLAGMSMAVWALLASHVQSGRFSGAGGEALPVGLFLATLKVASGIGTMLLAAVLSACEGAAAGAGAGNPVLAASIGLPAIGSACLLLVHCLGRSPGRPA